MNWNLCFNRPLVVIAVALFAVVALASPAAAVAVDTGDAPDSAEVGSDVSVTFELTELYAGDAPRQWELNVTTQLQNVSWEIRTRDAAGDDVDVVEDSGNSTTHWIDADDGVNSAEVTIRGTVPPIEEFSYDPEERFTLATFTLVREGGGTMDLGDVTVQQYTTESADARDAIDAARAAIDDAEAEGGDVTGAERTLNNAIEAYNDGSHGLAVELANQAVEEAEEAIAGAQRGNLILFAVAGVLGVAIIAGIVYWFRSRRQPHDKLG